MVNLAEMDRQDFLRFLGVAFGSAVLASCRLKPPPPETHIPSKEPIQGQIGNMDSTVAVQPLSGDQQQNSRKITMESTIDVNSITVENPLEGLEVRTLKLNDFFTVTFLMTEHHLEDVENNEKMKKIKEEIESSSCVIPEYYPPAIEEMKKSSFWVNFIADPDEKFIPFFSKIYKFSMNYGKPIWVLDPANQNSFMDVAAKHGVERLFGGRGDESTYRMTINSAFLLTLANKYKNANSRQKCVYILPKAHADEILSIITNRNPPSISMQFPDQYTSISPTNRAENWQTRVDQYTAQQYIPQDGNYITGDIMSLLP